MAVLALLAGCAPMHGGHMRMRMAAPVNPESVAVCSRSDCPIVVKMALKNAPSDCSFDLPAFVLAPRTVSSFKWMLEFPVGGPEFRFAPQVVPVVLKSAKTPPWQSPVPAEPATSYEVTRNPYERSFATDYGLKVQVRAAGGSWQDCTQLDPIIISMD
jgi:hypothetical protein